MNILFYHRSFLILALSFLGSVSVFSKSLNTDSLEKLLKGRLHDTTRIVVMCKLADEYRKIDLNKADSIIKKALDLADKTKIPRMKSFVMVTYGLILDGLGDTQKAIEITLEAERIDRKSNYVYGLGGCYNNLGIYYRKLGIFTRSLEYQLKALGIKEKLNDKPGIASALNNIGINCVDQKKYEEGIEYYKKSLVICHELNEPFGKALVSNNIGYAYQINNQLDSAEKYLIFSLETFTQIKHDVGAGNASRNLGVNYFLKRNFSEGNRYLFESLSLRKKANDVSGIAQSYTSLFRLYYIQKDLSKAFNYIDSAFIYVRKSNNKTLLLEYFEYSYPVYYEAGKIQSAYQNLLHFSQMKDSIFNKENSENISRMRILMETEKKEKQILNLESDQKQKELQIEKERSVSDSERKQKIIFLGGLIAAILFLGFSIYAFLQKRKDNRIIQFQKQLVEEKQKETEHQKHVIEEKHKEITDSINYAKRIQEAILPSRYSLAESLKNGFVLYKPKDIVAGDFYWLEKIVSSADKMVESAETTVYFAAADCTGHGVPGAMVSVVCSNAISKALLEEGITETGKILDRTRELVIEKFSKSEENVRDGMDISLCCLNYQKGKLQWSGANNPLWLIRKNSNGLVEFIETKPNKQPIGKTENPTPFTTHNIDLQKGDTIYIFTDGFQDQFGGADGKKFKAAKLKELLLSIQNEEMDKQKEIINSAFENWRGVLEQVDDVCIIGVRI